MNNSKNTTSASKIAGLALAFSVLGVMAFALSGYGYQWGWWGLYIAFRFLIPGGAILGVIGLIFSFVYAFYQQSRDEVQGSWRVYTAAILGFVVLLNFGYWFYQVQQYPPIHDITTDTQNPPEFVEIVPLRADAPNPTEYGGEEVAKIQKEHYPDIQTLILDEPFTETFKRALEAAEATSWNIVGQDQSEGRIEATHTLPWYGFKDDIVIRVDTAATDSTASAIDVRSVSRIGQGDIGVNADRIRDYLSRLE